MSRRKHGATVADIVQLLTSIGPMTRASVSPAPLSSGVRIVRIIRIATPNGDMGQSTTGFGPLRFGSLVMAGR